MNLLRFVCLILIYCALVQAEESPYHGTDLDGKQHVLLSKEKKAVTLIFITHDCPIANGYSPEINRIVAEYTPKNIDFYLVHVDPDLTPDAARKHAQDFGYKCVVLLDTSHALVKATGATTTPEAIVLSSEGSILYRGRIDDRHVDYGKSRIEPTHRELREALDAILAGKPVPVAETKTLGCFIPDLQKK